MVTYRGLPPPVLGEFLSHRDSREHYAAGTQFQIGRVEMVTNTGTYIDSPYHRFPGRKDVSELSLAETANLEGVLVDATARPTRAIDRSLFEGVDIGEKAVLVHTGWARRWGTDRYFDGHPHLTRDAADLLVAGGAALVGIDSLNVDDTDDGERPVHTILLDRGIPVVEHLCGLGELVGRRFRFFAAPLRVRGMGSFPVRAFAVVDGG